MKYNLLENNVKVATKSIIQFKLVYEQFNTLKIYNDRKQANSLNKLFEDVESSYLTLTGLHQRKTEFVIDAPEYNIWWRIECKGQLTVSNIIGAMYYEFDCVKKLKEDKIIFILEGTYQYPYIIKQLTDKIKELKIESKVRIWSYNEYVENLKGIIKKK